MIINDFLMVFTIYYLFHFVYRRRFFDIEKTGDIFKSERNYYRAETGHRINFRTGSLGQLGHSGEV